MDRAESAVDQQSASQAKIALFRSHPKVLYQRQGRSDEYAQPMAKYNVDRREYLRKWKGLTDEIVTAL